MRGCISRDGPDEMKKCRHPGASTTHLEDLGRGHVHDVRYGGEVAEAARGREVVSCSRVRWRSHERSRRGAPREGSTMGEA